MVDRFERRLRIVATGLCFVVFGLGGLFLRLVVFPLVMLVYRAPHGRRRVSREVIHHSFRFFVWFMKSVGVMTYELRGLEKLKRPGLLVLANHPSLIDVVFLISLIPQADCVIRANLAINPFTRGPVRAAGYVLNDRGVSLVEDCRRSLESGNTLIIFPEGTRTPLEGPLVLQRGAANVAIRSAHAVTPVVIRCRARVLTKEQKWYQVPASKGSFIIEVHDDIPVESLLHSGQPTPIAVRQLNAQLKAFFEQETRRGEVGTGTGAVRD